MAKRTVRQQIACLPARLITKAEAAHLCNLSISGFGRWVAIGKMPTSIPGIRRWDRLAIERAIETLTTQPPVVAAPKTSELEQWREHLRTTRRSKSRVAR